MFEQKSERSANFNGNAVAGANVVHGMRLENHYKVEAYAPISINELREMFGKPQIRKWVDLLAEIQMNISGVTCYRVGDLVGLFPEHREQFEANPMWVEEFDNLVVNVGLNDSLDKHLKGSSYTAVWYVGLTDGTPTVAAADTMASHAGWTEVTDYSESNRQNLTLGTVSGQSVDNSASKASFSINASTTVGGAFVVTDNTKSGTSGILYGAGAFSGGNRSLQNGDTLNVTVTLTAAAS